MSLKRMLLGGAALLIGVAAVHASTVIGLSLDDQARLSEMVVIGEVVGQRGVQHPHNGIETSVSLKVTDVLKGSAQVNQTVVFHTRSGEVDGEVSEAMGEAVFQPGRKVLVFIESIQGRRYNLGLSMGVWDANEDRDGRVVLTRALRDGLTVIGEDVVEAGPLSLDEMKAHVDPARRVPRFDNETLRSHFGQGR